MKVLFAMAIAACIILAGCMSQGGTPQVPDGSDSDEHGCMGSAGYVWCAQKGKCLRPFEENCTEAQPAGTDVHGCIEADGYSWCQAKQACIKLPDTCGETQAQGEPGTPGAPVEPVNFCSQPQTAHAYACAEYTVVEEKGGAGIFSIFNKDGIQVEMCTDANQGELCSRFRLYAQEGCIKLC